MNAVIEGEVISSVIGSGGGGGKGAASGGGRSAVEDADSLQSRANLSLIDLLGEGQIGGLVNGAKSIMLNDTPLMSEAGVYNFTNVKWDSRSGTQSQTIIPGFSDVETPHIAGDFITKVNYKVITITNVNVDRVRVIMATPALLKQDTTTGDMHGTEVSYRIEVSKNGGAYAQFGTDVTIKGKTKSKYQRSHVVTLPKGTPIATSWSIKITRLTDDSTSGALQNQLQLDSYVEIVDVKLNFPNSALVSIALDPQTFNSIPKRSYRVKGLHIRVPSNYNATSRVYTGVWDGLFITAVSSNPAWVLFDLLTNRRYGLGNNLCDDKTLISNTAIQQSIDAKVDKWALYNIGKYCDVMVDDGFGGTEPRFTINTAIQTQGEAYKLISDISSVFRGMAYWGGNIIGFTQDSAQTPSLIFSQANVVDGVFNYTGSARKNRHSVMLVTWNDPLANYKQRVEYVEDEELVGLIGVKKDDVVAFGCTSRGQANRLGKWMLYTERYESNLISFKVGMDASLALPGEIVKIHDPFRAGKRMSGRIQAVTTTSVTLDAPITLAVSGAVISFRRSDNTLVDRTVLQGVGTHAALTWTTALSELPVVNGVYVVSETPLVPMLARVVSIKQDKTKQEYDITAVEHNPLKYGAIEQGLKIEQQPTSILDPFSGDPENLVFDETTYFVAPGVIGTKLHASWEGKAAYWTFAHRITTANKSSNWQSHKTKTAAYEVIGLKDGDIVDVRVQATSTLGKKSHFLTGTRTILGKTAPPAPPTNFSALARIKSVELRWDSPLDIDFSYVEIYQNTANNSLTATVIGKVYGNTFLHTGLATSSVTQYYWLKSVDTTGNKSTFAGPANSSTLPEVGEMVALLQGQIAHSNLATALGTRINLIDGADTVVGSVAYRIAQEATARGTAITNEQTLRQDGDTALSQSISMITASSTSGFDSSKVWYFDTDLEGWDSVGATLSWSGGNVRITSTGANPVFRSPWNVEIVGSTYSVIKIRVKRLAGAGWDGTVHYSTYSHDMASTHVKTVAAPAVFGIGDTAIIDFDMSQLTVGGTDWVDSIIRQFKIELGATIDDVFDVDWVAVGRNGPAASTAGLLTEMTARVSGDLASANSISALSAQINDPTTGLSATIVAEQTVRANAITTVSDSVTTLGTTVGSHTTSIQNHATSINGIGAKYTVKIDNNGFVAGYGLISELNNGAVVSEFGVRADKFFIASPNATLTSTTFNATATGVNVTTNVITTTSPHQLATGSPVVYTAVGVGSTPPAPLISGNTYYVISVGPSTLKLATSLDNASALVAIDITAAGSGTAHTLSPSPSAYAPFMVLTTPTQIDGTMFNPGVYIDNAMITKLTASQIDTRGLSIRDASGNIILAAGTALDYAGEYINADGTKTPYINNRPTSLGGINATEGTKLTGISSGATKNTIFRQGTTVPTGTNGDIWYVTAATAGYTTGATYLFAGSWTLAADVTSKQIAGTGVNIAHPRYATFEESSLPPLFLLSTVTASIDVSGYFGSKCLKLSATGANGGCVLGATSVDYNIRIEPGKKWILSAFAKSSVASVAGQLHVKKGSDGGLVSVSFTTSGTLGQWSRVSGLVDLSADTSTAILLRLDNDAGAGVDMWFDGIMLEAQTGELTTPSPYHEPPNFLTTYIGELDATKSRVYRQSSSPSGGVYSVNDLWFDTDSNPSALYQWSGTAWVVVSNNVTNTSELTDDAHLGMSASWIQVAGRPTTLGTLDSALGLDLAPPGSDPNLTLTNAVSNSAASKIAIADIATDDKFTPVEKKVIRKEWDVIYKEKATLEAQADTLGVVTEKSAYTSNFTLLANYLNNGVAWTLGTARPNWINAANSSVTTDIVGETFRGFFKNYYDAKISLINAMTNSASTTAIWSGIGNIPEETIYNNDDAVALGFNPTFSNWTGTYPEGWILYSTNTIAKETTLKRVGKYSIKMSPTGAIDTGISKRVSFDASPLPIGTFVSGTIDVYIASYTGPGRPGIRVDLFTSATVFVSTPVRATTVSTGVWQRVPFTARVGATQQIFGIRIYLFGSKGGTDVNYDGYWSGDVYFDNMRFALFDSSVDNTSITLKKTAGTNDYSLSNGGVGDTISISGLGFSGDLNATKNTVTQSSTAPVSPTNGDIWIDTATNSIKTRVGGVWVSGATKNTVTSGTIAARATLTAGSTNGDFYLATDEKILYQKIGGAWIASVNKSSIYTQNTAPAGTGVIYTQDDLWINPSSTPPTFYRRDVATSQWVRSTPTSLAEINAADSAMLTSADSNATAAKNAIADIASDSKLTPSEKKVIKKEWDAIFSERDILKAQAETFGVVAEKTTYTNSFTALATYLNNGAVWTESASARPEWINFANTSVTTDIIGETFRSTFKSYYDARVALIKKVTDTASVNIKVANDAIADIASDSKFTPVEKKAVRKEWDAIYGEKSTIIDQATVFGITTEKDAYISNFTSLANYLNGYVSGSPSIGVVWTESATVRPDWITSASMSITTTIDGNTFRAKFANYYSARAALVRVITDTAKTAMDAINDIANDNRFTTVEKKVVKREWGLIFGERDALRDQGNAFLSVPPATAPEVTTYTSSFDALAKYLNAGTVWVESPTALPVWIDDANLPTTTNITGSTFRSKFKSYYDAKSALIKKVTDAAATTSLWTGVSGTGKPADNADVTNYGDVRVSNSILDNNVLSIARPIGASYSGGLSNVGAIKIRLPQLWTNTRLRFVVDIYNYVTGGAFSVEIGGQNHTTGWLARSATIVGQASSNYAIRFGHDGVKACIWIGELTTSWDYPKVTVRDFRAGDNNFTVAQWDDGWVVSTVTAFDTVTATDTDNLPHASDTNMVGGDLASAVVRASNKINSTNISTYIAAASIDTARIANAAITTALIANAAITNAQIGDAAVDTLSIGGNSVTVPQSIYLSADISGFAANTWVNVLSITVPAVPSATVGTRKVLVHSMIRASSSASLEYLYYRIYNSATATSIGPYRFYDAQGMGRIMSAEYNADLVVDDRMAVDSFANSGATTVYTLQVYSTAPASSVINGTTYYNKVTSALLTVMDVKR